MNQQTQTTGFANMNGHARVPSVPRFRLDYRAFAYLHQLMRYKTLRPTPAHSRFASQLAIYFPEVAASIDEADFGIVHLEVAAMKLASAHAIAKRDWDTLRAHFAFMNDLLLKETGIELRDAIHVSYLGNLFYGETALNYAKARCLLPKPLSDALHEIEQHYEHLAP